VLQDLGKGTKRTYFSVIFIMPLSPSDRTIVAIQIYIKRIPMKLLYVQK